MDAWNACHEDHVEHEVFFPSYHLSSCKGKFCTLNLVSFEDRNVMMDNI